MSTENKNPQHSPEQPEDTRTQHPSKSAFFYYDRRNGLQVWRDGEAARLNAQHSAQEALRG